MNFEATKDFAKWATGFSGCDGGNIDGPIWFCGIEYGQGEDEKTFSFDPVSTPGSIPADSLREHLNYQYNRKMAKIYAKVCGRPPDEYFSNAQERQLMSAGGDVFKMNLFPIAFQKDDNELWEKWIYDRTGLPTKSIYRAWCQVHRFTRIKSWVFKHNPKLIVATSSYYQPDFMMAFGGVDLFYEKGLPKPIPVLNRKLAWLPINNNKTILAMTPFLGYRWGINSDELMSGFGERLNEICVDHFGKKWLSG